MQIVIDIPDDEYFKGYYTQKDGINSYHSMKSEYTILPKGHGRLVDIGECDSDKFYESCGGKDSLITVESAFDMLEALPTVIEADKESNNDNT